jgi:hypothetical protein
MESKKWDAGFVNGKIRMIRRGSSTAFRPEDSAGLQAFCRHNTISEVILTANMPDEIREIIRFALQPTTNTVDKLVAASQIESMDENEFWELVERVQWSPNHDYTLGKQRLVRHLRTAERCQAFRETYDQLRFAVSETISEYEVEHATTLVASSDSYEDLVAHIVGLGRSGYESSLRQPDIIFHRAMEGDYSESFSYCVPFPEDFLISSWTWADRQRNRRRQVKHCVQDIRGSVETLLRSHLDKSPSLYHSPLADEIKLAVNAVVTELLGKDS